MHELLSNQRNSLALGPTWRMYLHRRRRSNW